MMRAPFLFQRVISLSSLFQGLSITNLLPARNNDYYGVLLVLACSFPWQDLTPNCGKPTRPVSLHL